MVTKQDEKIANYFSLAGTILGLIFNISPFLLLIKIIKKEAKYQVIPLSMLIFNTGCGLFWLCYWVRNGIMMPAISAFLNTLCTIAIVCPYIYYRFNENMKHCILGSFVYLDIVALCYYYFGVEISDIEITGAIASVINVLQYAGPGQNIITVCKTGDVSLLPITSCALGLVCSSSWFMVGVFLSNVKCMVPNGIGILLSILQIIVWFMNRNNKVKKEGENGKELVSKEDKEKN